MTKVDPTAILHFWFGLQSDGFADADHRKRWFAGGPEFDAAIGNQFGTLHAAAQRGELEAWRAEPTACLAYVLVCDQFPRNIYRGQSVAFGSDLLALDAARAGIEKGLDRQLSFDERCFFYLPFEHSENIIDQHTCVGLFAELRDATPAGLKHHTGDYLRYAHQHRDVIVRFGRFPHRNRVLGRESTAAELIYLEDGSTFGQ